MIFHPFNIKISGRPGSDWCPQVGEYPELGRRVQIAGQDHLITALTKISITFDYPLTHPVEREFTHEGGFRYSDFWRVVYEGYKDIYERNEVLDEFSTGFERLYLEGISEVKPGVFRLVIGS